MQNKQKKQLITILALIAFFIATIEGFLFFQDYKYNFFIRLLMSFENSMKVFVFSPTIKMSDCMGALSENPGFFEAFWAYAYVIALFVGELCTAGALFLTIEKIAKKRFISFLSFKNRNKESLIIFGYNEDTMSLIDNSFEEYHTIYLFEEGDFSDETEIRLLKRNVRICNYSIQNLSEKEKKKICKILSRSKKIVLMNVSAGDNMTTYLSLTQILGANTEIRCFLRCEEDGVKDIIEKQYNDNIDSQLDLSFFSIGELRAIHMFKNNRQNILPYMNKKNPQDVHVLVAGFGMTGKEVLRKTVLLGATGSTNSILIDVVDRHADHEADLFMSCFHEEVLDKDESIIENNRVITYHVLKNNCDGSLKIRFINADIRGRNFKQLVGALEETENVPYTLCTVCVTDSDTSLQAMTAINDYFRAGEKRDVPIAIRMAAKGNFVANSYTDGKGTNEGEDVYKNVFSMGEDDAVLKIDVICADIIDEEAKIFNEKYNSVQSSGEKNQTSASEKTWRELALHKKESNRSACFYYNHYLSGDFPEYEIQTNDQIRTELLEIRKLLKKPESFSDWIDSAKDDFNRQRILEIAKTEHRRWEYAMVLSGWSYGKDKVENKKIHDCMIGWEALSKERPETLIYDFIPAMMYLLR